MKYLVRTVFCVFIVLPQAFAETPYGTPVISLDRANDLAYPATHSDETTCFDSQREIESIKRELSELFNLLQDMVRHEPEDGEIRFRAEVLKNYFLRTMNELQANQMTFCHHQTTSRSSYLRTLSAKSFEMFNFSMPGLIYKQDLTLGPKLQPIAEELLLSAEEVDKPDPAKTCPMVLFMAEYKNHEIYPHFFKPVKYVPSNSIKSLCMQGEKIYHQVQNIEYYYNEDLVYWYGNCSETRKKNARIIQQKVTETLKKYKDRVNPVLANCWAGKMSDDEYKTNLESFVNEINTLLDPKNFDDPNFASSVIAPR